MEYVLQLLPLVISLYVFPAARSFMKSRTSDANFNKWVDGASLAAGRIYLETLTTDKPLKEVIGEQVRREAAKLLTNYAGTAAAVDANYDKAASTIGGELGKLLSADPTIGPGLNELNKLFSAEPNAGPAITEQRAQ